VELARALEARGVQPPPGTRIHISGCIHACGKHHIADIGLQGARVRREEAIYEAVDLYLGGRLGPEGRLARKTYENVTFDELPELLVEALDARPMAVPLA
jgi:ferredoxin-nitrite reductase